MLVMYLGYTILRPSPPPALLLQESAPATDDGYYDAISIRTRHGVKGWFTRAWNRFASDIEPLELLDLYSDEHEEDEDDREEDKERQRNLTGRWRLFWKLWYQLA